jgi:hypothetical protein
LRIAAGKDTAQFQENEVTHQNRHVTIRVNRTTTCRDDRQVLSDLKNAIAILRES